MYLHYATAHDGYSVPIQVFESPGSQRVILVLPAMGMPAGYYQKLGRAIQQSGYHAVLFEQRGHGKSSLRASWRHNFGFKSWIEFDLPACFDWIRSRFPNSDVTMLGHSIGAHIALCYLSQHPQQADSLIICACGTPWKGAFELKTRLQLRFLVAMMRLSCRTIGYFPGNRFGFAGREARDLVEDWLEMYAHNHYVAKGMNTVFDQSIRTMEIKVLGIRMEHDEFAPQRASEQVYRKLSSADLSKIVLSEHELGTKADHFQWARRPDSLVEKVKDWLMSQENPSTVVKLA